MNKKVTISSVKEKFLSHQWNSWHKFIEPISLLPKDDNSLLFTSSWMVPLLKYLRWDMICTLGNKVTNSQICFRANDLDEIWDHRHTTWFEMLGNWSFNDYFKREQLDWWYNFLINELQIDPSKIYQTCYKWWEKIERDNDAIELMKEIFSKNNQSYWVFDYDNWKKIDLINNKIFLYDSEKNRWQRWEKEWEIWWTCSETFYDTWKQHDLKYWDYCHPNCDCGRFVEIWNSVFMNYTYEKWERKKMKHHNIDFWWWLERLVMASQWNIGNIFLTDAYINNINLLEERLWKKYIQHMKQFEIITDHIKSITFLLKDWCHISNKWQWYFLRKLIRNLVIAIKEINDWNINILLSDLVNNIRKQYSDDEYLNIDGKEKDIFLEIQWECNKFVNILDSAKRIIHKDIDKWKIVTPEYVFNLQSTFWIPLSVANKLLSDKWIIIDQSEIDLLIQEHKNLSKNSKFDL